ncbi:MAG: SDR family NAD(P)-dependent oxidoreductase [Bdellovibrionota bacterium]
MRKVEVFVADISNKEQVDAAVALIHKHFGTIDILVNNAGILRDASFVEDGRKTIRSGDRRSSQRYFFADPSLRQNHGEKNTAKIISLSSVASRGNFDKPTTPPPKLALSA